MPRGQPFTRICQQAAQLAAESRRADMHLHSTASDGLFTPTEVVQRAALRGLGAIALTDHDTLAGWEEALAARSTCRQPPEIIPAVEITCSYRGRGLHLLAYFVDPYNAELNQALAELRCRRRERFLQMLERLPQLGLHINEQDQEACLARGHVLGRPDLARLLCQAGLVATPAEAFEKFLDDRGPVTIPNRGLPVAEAIERVRSAGGVTSWAHPPLDVDLRQVEELRSLGLHALEAFHPSHSRQHETLLLHLAELTGLAVTGGSDNHGPTPTTRAIGTKATTRSELLRLRSLARQGASSPCPS
jgi:predicted metal-dependent phosphoesterase TrpH